uniref:Ig-like domain-containing protein n=1 Tax=Gopherus evgoodei TaxID=1825980 RepID=A0A8C4YIZ3_9SAUR
MQSPSEELSLGPLVKALQQRDPGIRLGPSLRCLLLSPQTVTLPSAPASGKDGRALFPEHPAPSVGQNVTLSVEGGLEPLRHFDWYRGRLADGSTRIFSYFLGQERPQRNGVQFTGREVGFPNGSLLLQGAQANDSGTYQVALQLVPQEKLAKPTVTASKTQVPENGTLTLTCNTSPSADTVLWLQNRSVTQPRRCGCLWGRVRYLFIPCSAGPLLPNDPLPYCVDGPESARIDPPGPITLTLGSPLTLTCVADSVPALSYSWFLNGNKLPQTGSSLTFDLTTLNLGTYECQADNPVTGLTANAEIKVLGA